jgi:hypothetical protein
MEAAEQARWDLANTWFGLLEGKKSKLLLMTFIYRSTFYLFIVDVFGLTLHIFDLLYTG